MKSHALSPSLEVEQRYLYSSCEPQVDVWMGFQELWRSQMTVFNECKFMAANILIYTIDFLSQLRGFHEIALCYKIDWSDVVHYTVLKSDTFYKPKFLVFCEILGIERIGCTFVKLCGLVNCRSSVQMKSSFPLPQQRKIHKVTFFGHIGIQLYITLTSIIKQFRSKLRKSIQVLWAI